ncbi:MAG: hypothetical protein ACSHX0_08410 [Akkermansiaceae bacterium]
MATQNEPQLAAPGAGLPAPMLFIAKRLFALKCKFENKEAFVDGFRKERIKIRELVDSCESEKRAQRVLVPRLRGLEDSSRYYSMWMTLDHLRITNDAFAFLVTELSCGRVPDMTVSTADVKPDPAVTESVEAAYEASCDAVLNAAANAGELKSEAKLAHPWFGIMDAHQWLALANLHMSIHRAQVSAIAARLER